MEVRPYVKTGVAVVSAGVLVAAMPAIVPSPTPPDMKVAAGAQQSLYTDVALKFTSQELFNAIFSGFPDTEGPAGAVGVSLLLSDEIFGADSLASTFVSSGFIGLADAFTAGNPLINEFVNGGVIGLATALFGADPVAAAFLDGGIVGVADLLTADNALANAFVTGGIVGVADLLTAPNPLANAFVTGGVIGVADLLTAPNPLANTFVNGGITAATEAVLLDLTAGDPVINEGIQSFFSGYPFEDGDLPAGPAGIVGLVHYLLDRLAGNPTQPPAEEEEENLETLMLSVESESGPSLLSATAGPADLPEANLRTFDLNVEDKVAKADEPDPDDSITAAAATAPAPAAAPASAPELAPAPAETPTPATPVVNEGEDDADGADDVTDDIKGGNKVEPETILLEQGTGGGGTAWDETVKRWQDFGKALGFGGAAPAPESTPDTGDAEGSAEGAS